MFAVLAAVAFGIASLISFGAVSWPHLGGWYMLGFALLSLHLAYAVALPHLTPAKRAPQQ